MKQHTCQLIFLTIFFVVLIPSYSHAQPKTNHKASNNARRKWVDDIYNRLTIEERIGQLFMVPAYSAERYNTKNAILRLIHARQIGGVIFMHGNPTVQAGLVNEFQQAADVPLFVATDAEWGVGMRLDSVADLPKAMMLGAANDSDLAYRVGAMTAMQCKRLGIQIDFAPDADVNSNPMNPIVNARAFGEDKALVARLSTAYMHGMQDNGIIACAKHFPGHGDTRTDSHKGLPRIDKTLAQLDTLELCPFKEMIEGGLAGIMTGHLAVPTLDTGSHISATLSKNIISGLLKGNMGFNGLVFTDALNMVSVTQYFHPGDIELRAFEAGNDVLLFPGNIPLAITKIKDAITTGKIPEAVLEEKVKKILAAKYDAGLAHWAPVNTQNIISDLNEGITSIREEATCAAVTIIRDDNHLAGKINAGAHVRYIGVNAKDSTVLQKKLQDKLPFLTTGWLPKACLPDETKNLLNIVNQNDVTIVAIHNINFYPLNNYGLDLQELLFLRQIIDKPNVVVVLLGNAYAMQTFGIPRSGIVTYEDDAIAEDVAAKVLLGKMKAKGKLPYTPALR
jgi:beta-N-acetylhexosaminidase